MTRWFLTTPNLAVDREHITSIWMEDNATRHVHEDQEFSCIFVAVRDCGLHMIEIRTEAIKESYARLSEWFVRGHLSDFELSEEEVSE
jgi:hypothetical protein